MSKQQKQWAAIVMMFFLFAMIAFVTNLCNPMAVIVKNQFGASNFAAQIGNAANFIAYLVMGIPSGILLKKIGYKKTALLAIAIGFLGVFIQWMSGWESVANFWVYVLGAFVAGFCMCMLNTVVNPMLNILGGGGKTGNQLIQFGGVCNSFAAVAVTIIMGSLIGEATKAKISDATPALFIAMGVFVVAFIVLMFTKIQEPDQHATTDRVTDAAPKAQKKYSAFSFQHFNLGILAIFLYMGLEVGTPTYVMQYLTTQPDAATPGLGIDANIVGGIVALYWFLMLIGRLCGGLLGAKFSSRQQISVVATLALVFVLLGMFLPQTTTINMPGIDWGKMQIVWAQVPVGILFFILVGLCTSVMWGGIFNMAVEGLGKYTSIASGAFMTMVFGCGVLIPLQGWVADLTHNFMTSYWVVIACAAYILFYALIGSRNVNKDIPTT
ncbi:MAG: MFS transporter [Bacteroidaceae bacterium]|nr:MFS transporter [Bacteroidaceae bacterium]